MEKQNLIEIYNKLESLWSNEHRNMSDAGEGFSNLIKELKEEITSKPKQIKQINFSPLLVQMLTRRLGMFGSTYLGNDVYYLYSSVMLMWEHVGEKYMKQNYPDWDARLPKRLAKLSKVVHKCKWAWDLLEDKKFKEIDKEIGKKEEIRNYSVKISLLETDLYKLFVFFIKNSNLQRNTIPNDAWKILEHIGKRPFELERKKPMPQKSE